MTIHIIEDGLLDDIFPYDLKSEAHRTLIALQSIGILARHVAQAMDEIEHKLGETSKKKK